MNLLHKLKEDRWFFLTTFALWALVVGLTNLGFEYYGRPLPSAGIFQLEGQVQARETIVQNIGDLYASLAKVEGQTERGHVMHNLGTAYYDYYKSTGDRSVLDSVQRYYLESVKRVPDNARFYYNLGRVYTELRDHEKARLYYERTVTLDSTHILAMHNLALLYYFELHEEAPAQNLLARALSIKPDLPICNYVLGEIAVQSKHYEAAIGYYRNEVAIFARNQSDKSPVPVSGQAMRFAAAKSYYQLAILYSTAYQNPQAAQANFSAYLDLESDDNARKTAMAQMRKYWVLNDTPLQP
jgi:tetratricopeptide (TPR) repeat protein